MLLRHQYLKFAYIDAVLMVSKIFRGNLTAGMLAIAVTVVFISEIDTIRYFKHAMVQKICNATNVRLPGGILRVFCSCEKRSSSVGVITHVFV